MRRWTMGSILAVLAALATSGCSTTAGRCEDYCEYRDNCGGDPPSNCEDLCETDYDDASDSCQEAFDEAADCISEDDLSCTNSCDGEIAKFVTDCFGQFR